MAEPPTVLQVTYGAFSCTLEGFDDPVEALIAVTEYFRGVAASDPGFSGIAGLPDGDSLARFAERAGAEVRTEVAAAVVPSDAGVDDIVGVAGPEAEAAADEAAMEAGDVPEAEAQGGTGPAERGGEEPAEAVEDGEAVTARAGDEAAVEGLEAEAEVTAVEDGEAVTAGAGDEAALEGLEAEAGVTSAEDGGEAATGTADAVVTTTEEVRAEEGDVAPEPEQMAPEAEEARPEETRLEEARPVEAGHDDRPGPKPDDRKPRRNVLALSSDWDEYAESISAFVEDWEAEDDEDDDNDRDGDATARQAEAAAHPGLHKLLSAAANGSDEEALSRILSRADDQLADPEGARRRDAIARMKAAVAATEAERAMGEADPRPEARAGAFRLDLREAVREQSPIPSERAAPPPLRLVASQRIDLPEEAPAEEVAVAPAEEEVAPEPVAEELRPHPGTFEAFAVERGATTLPEVLEAAGAWLCFVSEAQDVSRSQLLWLAAEVLPGAPGREEGLRAFGTLLRQGRIVQVANGRFRVSSDSRFNPTRLTG